MNLRKTGTTLQNDLEPLPHFVLSGKKDPSRRGPRTTHFAEISVATARSTANSGISRGTSSVICQLVRIKVSGIVSSERVKEMSIKGYRGRDGHC